MAVARVRNREVRVRDRDLDAGLAVLSPDNQRNAIAVRRLQVQPVDRSKLVTCELLRFICQPTYLPNAASICSL